MKGVSDLDLVRQAKERLQRELGGESWVRRIGIASAEAGYALRLNVDPATGPATDDLPRECGGVPIEVLRTAGYSRR